MPPQRNIHRGEWPQALTILLFNVCRILYVFFHDGLLTRWNPRFKEAREVGFFCHMDRVRACVK